MDVNMNKAQIITAKNDVKVAAAPLIGTLSTKNVFNPFNTSA